MMRTWNCFAIAAAIVATAVAGPAGATTITFFDDPLPASNSDLPEFYGSNIAANAPGFVTDDGSGATPNIGLTWAPTGGPTTTGTPNANVLEFHTAASFANAGFTVPVLQFDSDLSVHTQLPDDPTIDFTVTGGFALKLNSFQIGNATDQPATEDPYRWIVTLTRLSDMMTVATQTTGLLSAGSLETVTFNYTGDPNESYRLRFDDEGANRVRTAIDNFSFSQVAVPEPSTLLLGALSSMALVAGRKR